MTIHRKFYSGIRNAVLEASNKISIIDTIPLYLVQKNDFAYENKEKMTYVQLINTELYHPFCNDLIGISLKEISGNGQKLSQRI